MAEWTIEDFINSIKNNIVDGSKFNLQGLIVDADSSKGFNYPYLLVYPNSDINNTLIIDCLNNYEEPMKNGEKVNQKAVDDVFNLFGNNRISSTGTIDDVNMREENYDDSLYRVAYRVGKGLNHIGLLEPYTKNPILMPLIPGYYDDTLKHTESELSKDFIGNIDVQLVNMIENAKKIIEERTNVKLDNRIIGYGHSKSSTFANNFTALHPELVKALIVGGRENAVLPIEEIRLRVQDHVKDDEKFEMINGIPHKNITQEDLNNIINDYNATKEEYQKEIKKNENGTYSFPMNYPIGISDIEHFVDFSKNAMSKEEYKKVLSDIPVMLFIGENEEETEGHFAYNGGTMVNGEKYKYAQDLNFIDSNKEAKDFYEVEKAGMQNRVLEYKEATRILFGNGDNERLRNYVDLAEKLGIDIQSKIYEGIGHGFNDCVKRDLVQSFHSISKRDGIKPLSDNGRADRVNPVFQLLRRAKVCKSGKKEDYEKKCSQLPSKPKKIARSDYSSDAEYELAEKQYKKDKNNYYQQLDDMMKKIDKYVIDNRQINSDTNMDRIYDGITTEELDSIFLKEKDSEKNEKSSLLKQVGSITSSTKLGQIDKQKSIINMDEDKNLENVK